MSESFNIQITKISKSKLPEVDFENLGFGEIFSDHMFVADYINGCWTDCRIVPHQNLSMNPANLTLHYAQSIFEGLKAHKNEKGEIKIFRPSANAERLIASAERLWMPLVPEKLFLKALTTLVSMDRDWVSHIPGNSLYIRPFQFANDSYLGLRPSETYKFMIITSPVNHYYTKPLKVKIEKQFTRATKGGVGAAKTSGNYAASLYAARKALAQGYDQLIWTDGQTHEFIEESSTMNLFFVINDILITPATNDTILAGITRDSALVLARNWGLQVEERPIKVSEVVAALEKGHLTEAFGIGTAVTISPIEVIRHEEIDYKLPKITSKSIANRILDSLTKIKLGIEEDRFDWIETIK